MATAATILWLITDTIATRSTQSPEKPVHYLTQVVTTCHVKATQAKCIMTTYSKSIVESTYNIYAEAMAKTQTKNTTKNLSGHVAIIRIIFGLMWAIDAVFKWQPSFSQSFLSQIQGATQGQPHWLAWWFDFWVKLIGHNPHVFAILTATVESLIALALLLGLARRFTYLSAAAFSILIWAIPEGFGGPYTSGATDIGTAIIYAIVFFALYGLDRLASPARWSVDTYISRAIPWWSIVANP